MAMPVMLMLPFSTILMIEDLIVSFRNAGNRNAYNNAVFSSVYTNELDDISE
jgi:hypothetical protein